MSNNLRFILLRLDSWYVKISICGGDAMFDQIRLPDTIEIETEYGI